MDTISMTTAVVTGARHLRMVRNGQDAVATSRTDEGAVVVVADGCGSSASSEVGARLGARLFADAVAARLALESPWDAAREQVVATLRTLISGRDELLHECFLFTLVAAAVTPRGASVWALGDGAYSFGGATVQLGPFANNQPPYLAYDLLGDPRDAHVAVAPSGCTSIVIATDGVCDLDEGLDRFGALTANPDALRRELARLARAEERIDWDARKVVRTPARLQDDCAMGVVHWRFPS
jgi:Protein phosphatase 2C